MSVGCLATFSAASCRANRCAGPAVAIVKRAAGTLQTRPQKAFAQATSFNLGFSPALAASRTSKSRLKELIFPRLMSDTRA